MDKREYLRSIGFEVGERGRFSTEMKEALSSHVNENPESIIVSRSERLADGRPAVEPHSVYVPPPPQKKQREESVFYAITTRGENIACTSCGECKFAMIYCECEGGPKPPRYLGDELTKWSSV
jgi:uncharacterized protein with PIN domain